ncbi:MAG: class I SAM-dependent methyltransferase [Patescibacteria group bacterium]|jgi:hypothetical protein
MTITELNFLKSAAGKSLLERYGDYDEAALFRLLLKSNKKEKILFLAAIVTLIKLRRKATEKFSRSSEMFFTTLGLEQSTGEKIARYISSRFRTYWKVVDLSSGIGGNLIFLAEHCRQVTAVDKNETNLTCAQYNCEVYGVGEKIKFINGEAQKNINSDADAFFLDPARDREGKSKTRSILNSQPPLLEILSQIFLVTRNVGVKISPAFDYQELELLPDKPEVEIISEDNTNKVAMLWFGDLKIAARRATILSGDSLYSYNDQEQNNPDFSSTPLAYLYEPNKAIIKAHLIDELAVEYGLAKINSQLSLLTGDRIVGSDRPGLWRIFKVLVCEPFSWAKLQNFLQNRQIERINILTKRFPLKPEELYKKLKIKEGGNLFLILTVLSDEKRYYVLAEKA